MEKQQKNMFADNNFFVVMGFMINKLKMSGNELICYAIIYGFSQAEGNEFKGSLNYLAQAMNVTKDNARKILCRLVEKGYITKKENFMNAVKFCSYSANMRGGTEIVPLSLNQLQCGTETVTGGGTETVPNNNIVYNNNSLSNTACSAREEGVMEDSISVSNAISIIDYYNERIRDTGRRLQSIQNIPPGLRRLLIYTIKEYGADDVKKAIEIATTKGNWCAENKKTLYFILNPEKIERILAGEYDNHIDNENKSTKPEGCDKRITHEERQASFQQFIIDKLATGRALSDGEVPF